MKPSTRTSVEVKAKLAKEDQENIPLDLLKELYRIYDGFNKHFTKGSLPRPMIIVSSVGKKKAHGWFSPDSWSAAGQEISEITLGGESFIEGPNQVFNTLLHEMAHLKNYYENGKKVIDCTPQQRHNGIFKKAAISMGLSVTSTPRFGSAHTHIDAKAQFAIEKIKPNLNLFELYRNMKLKEKAKDKKESKLKPVMISVETKELIEKASKAMGLTQKEFAGGAVQIMATLEERINNAAAAVFGKKFKNAEEVSAVITEHLTRDIKMKGDAKGE